MSKARKRIEGLSDSEQPSCELSSQTSHVLLHALHGCVVGARMALAEGDEQDVKVMLGRIDEIAVELLNRNQPKRAPRDK